MGKGILILSMCYFSVQAVVFLISIVTEHKTLTESVIRLHVVADSDEAAAQSLKLKVRDQVTGYLSREMATVHSRDEAERYLAGHLEEIRKTAQETLDREGCGDALTVSLGMEKFGRRDYDTFSLPAGRYESLRITIGSGRGHNWWCVVFPALCIPASAREFEDCAAASGLDSETVKTLEQGGGYYALRFGLLDALGDLKNFFS